MKIGDVIYCTVDEMSNKPARPCILISFLPKNKIKVLPVTSKGYNSQSKLVLKCTWLNCCYPITGFILLETKSIDEGVCVVSDCGSCVISPTLRNILQNYGIVV